MSFQRFDDPAAQGGHAVRLSRLRAEMSRRGLVGMIVPRSDAHQGEYVAEADARLAWLTGFTGSAGFAVILAEKAGVFVDGRYRVQVQDQLDLSRFTPVAWPETRPSDWLRQALPEGGKVGYDPWLHSRAEISGMAKALEGSGITLAPQDDNPVDAIWSDRPAPPVGAARAHPEELAGETAEGKRHRLGAALKAQGHRVALLTLPDSISWLLNIRGNDLPRNPVVQSFAILDDAGDVRLYADARKFDPALRAHLGAGVTILPPDRLTADLAQVSGPLRLDPATAPEAAFRLAEKAGIPVAPAPDPAILPKACKTAAELDGMRAAHLRDGVAMVRLLAWLDRQTPESLTEIDIVERLEALRCEAGIRDISFETIMGAGPNGAIVHYRVSRVSNRRLRQDDVLLIDSGGQYHDGTTDITRTLAVGAGLPEAVAPYTAVLRGMIALSRARFPRGVGGAHLDALARQFLWAQGLDYDHGTGHGVGAALCVHEGPVRISRASSMALEPGMILSNEPGYYREGSFGIRIENLVAVIPVEAEAGRNMLGFETLTLCPIDRRLLDPGALATEERDWLDAYHLRVREALSPLLEDADRAWLAQATRPLSAAR